MALDLDSFLGSHLSSDDNDDDEDDSALNSVPHRTVDEILNDSDSSTSSSPPPSPPSTLHRLSLDPRPQSSNDAVSVSSLKLSSQPPVDDGTRQSTDGHKTTQLDERLVRPRPSSFTRFKSGDFSDDPSRRPSRPFPSLFGGVRSNAKPGAALAAAVAASRSMPTPHAAAIKSRMSAGSERLQKVLDGGELSSTAGYDLETASDELGSNSNGDLNAVGSEVSQSDEKLLDDSNNDEKAGDLQTAANAGDGFLGRDVSSEISHESGGDFCNKEIKNEAEHASKLDKKMVDDVAEEFLGANATPQISTSSDVREDINFVEKSSISNTDDVENTNAGPSASVMDKNSILLDAHDSNGGGSFSSLHDADDNEKVDNENIATLESETGNAGNSIQSSGDNDEGVDGYDASSLSDINELVEERIGQLESRRINRKEEKKSRSPMKPLELAEELEKKHASSGLHWEEGAAAQPMRLEGVRRGSSTLGYFDTDVNNTITRTLSSHAFKRDHGSPHALVVHSNYIAVGMSRGTIVVVPSKYSAHNVDNMDSKMLILGLQGERSYAAVTSMCFNQQADLLLAGYGDGHITVWDMQKASVAKVITGEHTAPVVHTLFLGQDSQVTRQFKAVTGDCKGLVLLHSISVVPLLNRFSIKTQCLLDGQRTGTVLSASPLLFDEFSGGASLSSQGSAMGSASSIGGMMGGVVGGEAGWKLFNEGSSLVEEGVVVFATQQHVLVVRLTPTLEVYSQFPKPNGIRDGSIPYTAWKCTTESQSLPTENMPTEALEKVSLLAVAWDRKVQVAKLVKSELKMYGKWSLDSAAIGVAWLDDQMLVVLTVTGQLCLFAKDGTLIHQTSFAVDGSVGDDLVAYHTHFINMYGNPEKAYHNCLAKRGASIYILGPMHLIVSRLLPWKERIQVLRRAGDWMGALNMAMTIYDGQAHGVIDLPRTLDAVQEAIMPYLVELLLSYVEEVFSYISVAFCNQIGKKDQLDDPIRNNTSVHSEIKEQYTRVGGVAVEFCVHIKRTDILFDEIFPKFVAVEQRDTFLELLEPYILRDMLGSLPPEIMQALVEHYSCKGWLQRVEQCVLHMDISSLDFDQVVRLCREHGLYGALVYLFNKGLDDFRAPLEELLVVLRNSQSENAAAIGYRMLVYLKYCFSGLAFPPGQGTLSPSRLPSLRRELMQCLLEDSNALNSTAVSTLSLRAPYLNLYSLLELDTEATLNVLRCAFKELEIPQPENSTHDVEVKEGYNSMTHSQKLLVQNTVDALIQIIDKDISQADRISTSDDRGSVEKWPSKTEIGHLFEFIAYYVACGKANISKSVLGQILEYLTTENNFPPNDSVHIMTSKEREKQVLALLEEVPETDWDASHVLHLCEKAGFYQVCGLIHTIRNQYLAALDSYMKDVDEPVQAFSFINKTLLELSDDEYPAFRKAVISRIPELVDLNREGAFFLVVDHLSNESSHILSELRSHPRSLFLYLKTAIEVHLSGTLNFYNLEKVNIESVKNKSKGLEAYLERISDFPRFLRNNPVQVTDDMIELYLELLCQYERSSVLKFLETFDSYRVEHCLRLCQEYGIVDAASFLLERVGDVGSALLLTLSSLNDKFIKLDTAVESIVPNATSRNFAATKSFSAVSKLEEANEIGNILQACIGLCQRNTPRLNPEESEALWFRLLDSFCVPLIDSYRDGTVSEEGNPNGILAGASHMEEDEEEPIIKWRISKSHKGAHLLKKLFSLFIKEIVEGMIGYVRLPTIMSKLLSDNGSSEFGDFKLTILGMLGTYGFERRILDTAKSLIEDDTFYTMSLLKKGASHGYAPRGQICCICNCPFAKNSSNSGIRVFNCGHATHLECEILENGTSSSGSSSGCPVCMPNKKLQRSRNKSILAENGLVKKVPIKAQSVHGTTVHLHENDAFENAYAHQQISRFEILNSLQKEPRLVQIENMPQLRLAPPAVYHEKVRRGSDVLTGESSGALVSIEKQSRNKQLRELKVKGSSLRFPLKSNIFGKEKISKR
ncbi:uncharacterized protein LOC107423794 [Ziziphus jujuba]|uniref:Uncharacterized protein LOC107423794 n=1 Tax=Ziziphus jujuba TaxID=326968 RepID=A0A6P4AJU1_ZIZJJ|nr:uncharacterized protein LOC107423794 [Ziziphus jujuba]